MPPLHRRMIKGFAVALTFGLLAGGGLVAWIGLQSGKSLLEMLTENRKLRESLANLTREDHVGYAKVLNQEQRDGRLHTTLLFVVTDPNDPTRRLLERQFEIEGDVVFFDALIVKFGPESVADGRERALYLWRRIYGENMQPNQGFPIEIEGHPPARYASLLDRLRLPEQQQFWTEIWQLSNDPNRLAAAGVKAIYGNAVYKQLRPGLIYIFKLDANGGFYPETVPDL